MNKKSCLKIALIVILIIIIIITIYLILNKKVEIKLELKENTTFEINTEIKNMELLTEIKDKKIEILSGLENIDTSKLGTFTYNFKVKRKKIEIEYPVEYTIIDTTPPVIEVKREIIEIEEGTEINLLDNVIVADNSKEELEVKIDGEYDINIKGEYKIKYVVQDSSENKSVKEIKVKVNKKPEVTVNQPTISNNYVKPSNNFSYESEIPKSNYPTLAPYTIVPKNEVHAALSNPSNNVRTTKFFWYVSKVNKTNGEVTKVEWDVSCDSVKTIGAKEKAKAYMPSAPTGQQAIDLYKQNPNIHYGETILEVSY